MKTNWTLLLRGNWEIILATNYDCGDKEIIQLLREFDDIPEDQNQFSILTHWKDSQVPTNLNPRNLISFGLHRYLHTLEYTLTENHSLVNVKFF